MHKLIKCKSAPLLSREETTKLSCNNCNNKELTPYDKCPCLDDTHPKEFQKKKVLPKKSISELNIKN